MVPSWWMDDVDDVGATAEAVVRRRVMVASWWYGMGHPEGLVDGRQRDGHCCCCCME